MRQLVAASSTRGGELGSEALFGASMLAGGLILDRIFSRHSSSSNNNNNSNNNHRAGGGAPAAAENNRGTTTTTTTTAALPSLCELYELQRTVEDAAQRVIIGKLIEKELQRLLAVP